MTTQSQPLLLNDRPLIAYKNLAVLLGINKALVLQQLLYLMNSQEDNRNEYVFIDGRWWVYNSYAQWKKHHFPWMGESTIKKILREMESVEGGGFVISRQSVKNKSDQRKWYTIDFDKWQAYVKTHELLFSSHPAKNELGGGSKVADGYSKTTTKEKDSQPKVGGVQPETEMGQGDTQCAHVFSDGECIDCGQVEPPRVIQDDDGHFIAGPVKIYTPTPRQPVSLADLENTCPQCNEIIHDGTCLCDLYGSSTVQINWRRNGQYRGEKFCPTCEGGYEFVHNALADSIDGICYCDGVMRWDSTPEEMDKLPQSYRALLKALRITDPEWLRERKRRLSAPTLEPFADKNHPDAPAPTPLIPDDTLPPNDGRKVGRKPPSVDPAIKAATPINVIPRKERLVLPEEPTIGERLAAANPGDIIIAQAPDPNRDYLAEALSSVPEEAEPEAKPKTKKDIRDEMKTAVLDAVGWQPSDVNHWGRIQKVVTTLLKKGATVELLAEWRDWNAALECGKVQNPEGITGNGWPKFMKHKRDQATPTHKPTPELDIQVDEAYQ